MKILAPFQNQPLILSTASWLIGAVDTEETVISKTIPAGILSHAALHGALPLATISIVS